MIVGGQRFPDTAAGYRYAARHVFKLGPTFYDDARGLESEATRIERTARANTQVTIAVVLAMAAMVAWKIWTSV